MVKTRVPLPGKGLGDLFVRLMQQLEISMDTLVETTEMYQKATHKGNGSLREKAFEDLTELETQHRFCGHRGSLSHTHSG
eukprot:219561-Amphidinium_carterae.1